MRHTIWFTLSLLTLCITHLQATYLPFEGMTRVDHSIWKNKLTAAELYGLLNDNRGKDFIHKCQKSSFAKHFLLDMINTYITEHDFESSRKNFKKWINSQEQFYKEFHIAKRHEPSTPEPILRSYVLFIGPQEDPENIFPFTGDLLRKMAPNDEQLFQNCTLKFVLKELSLKDPDDKEFSLRIWSNPVVDMTLYHESLKAPL